MPAPRTMIALLAVLSVASPACLYEPLDDVACVWEGGQDFELRAAFQDGDVLFLELTNRGSPCGGDAWEVQRTVAADFAGYTAGDVDATIVEAAAGSALSPQSDGSLLPAGLDVRLRPASAMLSNQSISVLLSPVVIYRIHDAADDSELGALSSPAGR